MSGGFESVAFWLGRSAPVVTGTVSTTLEDVTSAAVGDVAGLPVTGTVATTLEDVTSAAEGTVAVNITGSLAVTLEDVASVATAIAQLPPSAGGDQGIMIRIMQSDRFTDV